MIGPLTYIHVNNTKLALKAQQKQVTMSINSFLIDVAQFISFRKIDINVNKILTKF